MKNKLTKITVAALLFLSLSINAYAAVKWAGSQDVEEAKAKITTIAELFKKKDSEISRLKSEVKDKDSVIRDKDKAIADKEKQVREKETVIKQLEQRISEKEKVIADLERELDNQSNADKQALKQAEKDVKELNELLGEVVEENK